MGFYKFMPSRYIRKALGGEFRFGALMYYRLLELVHDDKWIGDREEGQVTLNVDNVKIAPGVVDNNVRGKLNKLGFSGDGGIEIKAASFVQRIEGFVFCCSAGELSGLRKHMLEGDYDSCVSIPDIRALVQHLYDHGVCDDGRAVSDVFFPPVADLVNYCGNTTSFHGLNAEFSASPFIKRKDYEKQQEFRVFIQPKRELDVDSITLKIDPLGFVVEEFRNDVVQKLNPEMVSESLEVSLGKLQEILVRMKARRDECSELLFKIGGVKGFRAGRGTYEVDEFHRLDKKTALLAYWNLRNKYNYRDFRIDSIFVQENKSGGAITGFITHVSNYCRQIEEAESLLND